MSHVITFENHSPIRISDPDGVETVWDSDQQWGHCRLKRYITQRGKSLYWITYNSGMQRNGRDPETTRTYLPTVKAIRDYFADQIDLECYHAEVEALVDPESIIDVDSMA